MKVPFIDLKKINRRCYDDFNKGLGVLLDRCDFILGSDVQKFEQSFASYCGSKSAVSCNSGTDALYLSLKCLGVGPGDEVIVPSFSYAATLEAIKWAGAEPVFTDIDNYYCIMTDGLESLITEKTRVIMPVDLFGNAPDLHEIRAIADRHSIKVIEDAAQAHGTEVNGKKTGSISHLTCFSFYPTKILGAIGDGGIVLTDNEEFASRLLKLRNHGGIRKNQHEFPAYCTRLDSVQALFLLIKFRFLDEFITENKRLAGRYSEQLSGIEGIKVPGFKEGSNHFLYMLYCHEADKLAAFLGEKGIGTIGYYPYLLTELYGNNVRKENFPNAYSVRGKLLALPLYPGISDDEVDYVCRCITSFYGSKMEGING